MKTMTVEVCCRDFDTGDLFTVPVDDVEVYGEMWAVTPVIGMDGRPVTERDRWKVTHIPTGYSATTGCEMPKKLARKLARLLSRMCDGEAWHVDDIGDLPRNRVKEASEVVGDFLRTEVLS